MTDLEEIPDEPPVTPKREPPKPPKRVCTECEGAGTLSRYAGRWTWVAEPCGACDGRGWTAPAPEREVRR